MRHILTTFNYLPASVPPLPSLSLTDSQGLPRSVSLLILILQRSFILRVLISVNLHFVFRVFTKCLREEPRLCRTRGRHSVFVRVTQHEPVHATAISTLTLHVNGLPGMGLKSYLIDLIMEVKHYHRCQGEGLEHQQRHTDRVVEGFEERHLPLQSQRISYFFLVNLPL